MWLSKKLTQHEMQNAASAQSGTVTVEGAETAVYTGGEERGVRVASPRGFFWKPRNGENVLVIKGGVFGEETYIVGAVQENAGALNAGEIRIAGAGGSAEIILRNSGRIDINGSVFINGEPYVAPLLG